MNEGNICFSDTDLTALEWSSPFASIFQQRHDFHSSLWLKDISLCICNTFSLSLPFLWRTLHWSHDCLGEKCFRNQQCVYISATAWLESVEEICRNDITRSDRRFIFTFCRDFHSDFHSGWTNLHSTNSIYSFHLSTSSLALSVIHFFSDYHSDCDKIKSHYSF